MITKDRKHIPPAHWDFLTSFYDVICILLGFGKRFRKKIIKHLNLKGTERILDAGCGTGTLLVMLKNLYPSLDAVGIDPDEKAIKIAQRKIRKHNLDISLQIGTMSNMQFDSNSFDVVMSSLVFHHIPVDEKTSSLKECLRVLKQNGRMLLADFGPLKLKGFSKILPITKLWDIFEPIDDGRKGEIPLLMSKVGFKVNEVGQYIYGITFYEGIKEVK